LIEAKTEALNKGASTRDLEGDSGGLIHDSIGPSLLRPHDRRRAEQPTRPLIWTLARLRLTNRQQLVNRIFQLLFILKHPGQDEPSGYNRLA